MDITAEQHKAKQRFWRKLVAQQTITNVETMTTVQIARLAGDPQLVRALENEAFHAWFINDKAEEDLIKAGAESAIRALLDIITGVRETKSDTALINAAKIILDLSGVGSKNVKDSGFKDKQIAEMSPTELKAFIAQHMQQGDN